MHEFFFFLLICLLNFCFIAKQLAKFIKNLQLNLGFKNVFKEAFKVKMGIVSQIYTLFLFDDAHLRNLTLCIRYVVILFIILVILN